jgi:hypothetical protein
MDSIFIFEIDRIYRINWIFLIAGFRTKPSIYNPLRGERYCKCFRVAFLQTSQIPDGFPNFSVRILKLRRQADALFTVSSGNREKIRYIL